MQYCRMLVGRAVHSVFFRIPLHQTVTVYVLMKAYVGAPMFPVALLKDLLASALADNTI